MISANRSWFSLSAVTNRDRKGRVASGLGGVSVETEIEPLGRAGVAKQVVSGFCGGIGVETD